MLINEKMRGNKNIRNSVNALKFVLNWPEYPALSCYAGKVFCIIDPDGTILPCDRITYNLELSNIRNLGFKNAFTNMPDIKSCKGCGFCGTIELNALMSLSLRRIGPIYKFA